MQWITRNLKDIWLQHILRYFGRLLERRLVEARLKYDFLNFLILGKKWSTEIFSLWRYIGSLGIWKTDGYSIFWDTLDGFLNEDCMRPCKKYENFFFLNFVMLGKKWSTEILTIWRCNGSLEIWKVYAYSIFWDTLDDFLNEICKRPCKNIKKFFFLLILWC